MREELIIRDGIADTEAVAEYERSRRDLLQRGIAAGCATLAAAERMIAGSCPKSWIATGPRARSSGWMRSSSVQVFSLR